MFYIEHPSCAELAGLMADGATGSNLVVGLGEVGGPLADLLARAHPVVRRDIEPTEWTGTTDVMHVCYPYRGPGFVDVTLRYIAEYTPRLTLIHSTVTPGTTRSIAAASGGAVAYSPTRGKHHRMIDDLLEYKKWVAAPESAWRDSAATCLRDSGMTVDTFDSPEALELAKLLETSYFGLLIAWAQEMERYCRDVDAEYGEVMKFMYEIPYLPPVAFRPGHIGGHCVMPNVEILSRMRESQFLRSLTDSNDLKAREYSPESLARDERVEPMPTGDRDARPDRTRQEAP